MGLILLKFVFMADKLRRRCHMGLEWCCTKAQEIHHENSLPGLQRFLSVARSIKKCGQYCAIFRNEKMGRIFP